MTPARCDATRHGSEWLQIEESNIRAQSGARL